MSLLVEREIEAQLPGTWRLPETNDYAAKIALSQSGQFIYTISAASTIERARRLLIGDEIAGDWHVRCVRPPKNVSGIFVEVIRVATSPIAPPHQRGRNANEDDEGPFLVLNFTRLPNSILNLRTAHFPIEVGNWLNHVRQIATPDYIKILDLTKTELKVHDHTGIQVWQRV